MRDPKLALFGVVLAAVLMTNVPFAQDSSTSLGAEVNASTSVLRIGFMQQIDSLNPYVGLSDASFVFYGLVYDALSCLGNDLETVPNLAKSQWAVPDGYDADPKLVGMPYGSVWQYNLTQTANWIDGEPFTSDDVIYNIWLNAEPTHYDSMWAYQPYAYFMHEAWKVDEWTVRVSFWDRASGAPIPGAYANLISIPMLPKHLMEQLPGGFSYIGMNWTGVFPNDLSPGMPIVGTGPFMATPNIQSEWYAGDHITLVRNPNCHWAGDYGGQIMFDTLVLRFFQDSTAMTLALENGEIDAAQFPPTAYYSIKSQVESGSIQNVTCFDGPKITQYFTDVGFCMNNAGPNPSRLDPVIRQALHMATNKPYIVNNMYLGYGEPGSTLIPPVNSYWHYEPTAGEIFNYNLTAAASLLEANGYIDTNADGIRECTISSLAVQMGWVTEGTPLVYQMIVRKEYPEEKDIAQYLKSQWEQIGVMMQYIVVDEMTLATIVYSYSYDTVLWYWSADVDPNYILFTQSKKAWNGWSDNKYSNPAFEENYTSSVSAMDKAQREYYVDNCQRIHYTDSPYIILAYPSQTYAWRTDTFSGWGDWAADPGRSLDNYWTGNPLFFELIPEIIGEEPSASFTVSPTQGTVATVFFVDASACSDLEYPAEELEVRWDWEDDGTWDSSWTTLKVANHKYTSPGNYTIRMEVRDPTFLVNETTQPVVITYNAPVASFVVSPSVGNLTTIFLFDAWSSSDLETTTDALEVRWDWENDGTMDTAWTTDKTEIHSYSTPGAHIVRLEVKDAQNMTGIATRLVTIDSGPPSADAGPDQTVDVGTLVRFDGDLSFDDVEIVNYTWSFEVGGEGKEIFGASPSWEFSEKGTYVVTLTVRDSVGQTDTDTMSVTVEGEKTGGRTLADYWWVAPIVVVVVALAVALLLFMRKKSG